MVKQLRNFISIWSHISPLSFKLNPTYLFSMNSELFKLLSSLLPVSPSRSSDPPCPTCHIMLSLGSEAGQDPVVQALGLSNPTSFLGADISRWHWKTLGFSGLTRRCPRYFANWKRPRGGWYNPPGFLPSRPNFLKIFLMGMFSGSRNPTVIMKKFYLYCMTLKIKVKHLFAWPFSSPVVNMIQSWSWCRF